jgi:hypothetical protein
MNRERKTIQYNFSSDFTSPKSAHLIGAGKTGSVVSKERQIETARSLDQQLRQYKEME